MATVGMEARDDPSTTSADYNAMCGAWDMIDEILAGAVRVRSRGTKYLPKFQRESQSAYDLRKDSAPWRPEFDDALRSLCSKPFTKTVVLNPEAPEILLGAVANQETRERRGGLVDDIDGQGNSLHVFARDTFFHGVGFGLDAIYVTYPDAEPARTVAEEKASGVRPYWVHVRARDIIDLKLKVIGGRTKVAHIRIKESTVEADGFSEVTIERIRVVELDEQNRPIWKLYRKDKDGKYFPEAEGAFFGVAEVPVALFFTGPRFGNYRVKPPLSDLADVQIELYRALSNQESGLLTSAWPMLVMEGMRPPEPTPIYGPNGERTGERPAAQQEVGPATIIYAYAQSDGVQPSAKYIAPPAENLKEVREHINDIMDDFRRLALQPTTPKSGNMVATGQAIEGAKAHTAVQAWANGLADCLNQALVFTCQWLKIPDSVTVVMHTEFGADIAGTEEAKVLGDAEKRSVISKQTEREELARRGVLGPTFDEEREEQRLAEEQQGLEPEQPIDPRTGLPVDKGVSL